MIEVACTCNYGIPGIDRLPSHSHVGPRKTVRWANGHVSTIPEEMVIMNPQPTHRYEVLEDHPEGIRFWIDWKAYARAVVSSSDDPSPSRRTGVLSGIQQGRTR